MWPEVQEKVSLPFPEVRRLKKEQVQGEKIGVWFSKCLACGVYSIHKLSKRWSGVGREVWATEGSLGFIRL